MTAEIANMQTVAGYGLCCLVAGGGVINIAPSYGRKEHYAKLLALYVHVGLSFHLSIFFLYVFLVDAVSAERRRVLLKKSGINSALQSSRRADLFLHRRCPPKLELCNRCRPIDC